MTPSKPWKSSQFSCKIIRKLASYAIYIMIIVGNYIIMSGDILKVESSIVH